MIVPDILHNAKTENKNSKNIFITGDNLDALKHLENAYTSKVDVIYIDPPYNTGGDDFVYHDNFKFTDEDLAVKLGLNEKEIERVRALDGKSSHSAWLTFMYPRLVIAKRLLKDTGVIFISIDDNEQANLKLLCDEVFGEGNFVGDFIRKTKSQTNDAKAGLNYQHEFVLIYARKAEQFLMKGEIKNTDNYKNPDNDPAGAWVIADPSARSGGESGRFEIINPYTNTVDLPPQGRYWAFAKSTFEKWVKSGKVVFRKEIKDGQRGFIIKKYLAELRSDYNLVDSLYFTDKQFMNQSATKYMNELFAKEDLSFDYPKPVEFVRKLLQYSTQKDSLILDFFAGSGTTADAVMQLNKEDGGSRNYILVQLDEKVKAGSEAEKHGYKTIDEISRERIKKASEKIASAHSFELDSKSPNLFETMGQACNDVMDLGFKSFYLKTPNITTLEKIEEFVPSEELFVDDMISPFSAENLQVNGGADGVSTLLTTWLLDDGYPFDSKLERIEFGGQAIAYKNGSRLYILDKKWDTEATKDLLNRIGKNEMIISTIIVYAYSLEFEALRELKTNLKTNLDEDHKVELLKRF